MNYWDIAKENISIFEGKIAPVLLKDDYRQVEVFSPEKLSLQNRKLLLESSASYENTTILVNKLDTLSSARICTENGENVAALNFASAINPGGGFLNGAIAQEEDICRKSTLFASLNTEKAFEMYAFNRCLPTHMYSDYMLFSPLVWVFRDENLSLVQEPFSLSVITAPAPNLTFLDYDSGAKEIIDTMKERIRRVLTIAAIKGCTTVILGAWGCGAFSHDAKDVSQEFYDVLYEEGFLKYFKKVVFSVYVNPKVTSTYNYEIFFDKFSH
jgi:uncharacterized protein (TIGR02452 family)